MGRVVSRALAAIGWTLLGLAAAAGVALAAVTFLASAPFTRSFVAARVIKFADDAIAGHVTLKSVAVLPQGGVELEGLEISDPEGHLVLSVGRARVALDVTGLRRRAIGISLELDAPSVLLEEERGGGVSIARAFAPSSPTPSPPRPEPEGGGSRWTLYVSRLAIRNGDVWWVDAAKDTRLEASGLDLEARGIWGPERARVELRVKGALDEPVSAPLDFHLAAGLDGTSLRVPVLEARLGQTSAALAGEGDLARRSGRLALLRLDVARDLARTLASGVPPGADLDAAAYAESDGATLTAALRAEPAGGRTVGRADAAVALRLSDLRSVGFDVALDRLDPSRLAAEAPPGEITLTAHGAAAGRTLRELRGRVEARVQRSRLRTGEVRSAEIVARADRGTIEVSRATVVAPGVSLDGAARWREGGAVGGRIALDATDLAALSRNVAGLLGRRPAAIAGRARVEATLDGTSVAPTATGAVDAPAVRVGGVGLTGVRLTLQGAGPMRALSARVDGRVAAVQSGGADVARGVSVHGALAEGSGSLDAVATLPGFDEPARIEARGRLSPELDLLALSTLALSYPGTRWVLASPAEVSLAGPSVDRLELGDGVQRVVLSGGLAADGALDARASVSRLDLAHLPSRVLGAAGARGELDAEARATGRTSQPQLSATFALANGAVRGVAGIAARGSAAWDGAARRATAQVSLARGDGTVDAAAELPLPLAGRPGERIRASVRAARVAVADLLALAAADVDASGVVSADAAVEGTVGAPVVHASAAVADGRYRDVDGLGLELSADDPGARLAVSAKVARQGAAAASARAEAPLDLAALLARPAETIRGLRAAPLAGSISVTGLDLAGLSGHAGVPAGIAGRLDATATVSGSIARPRAEATADVSQGAWAGYADVGIHAALSLAKEATSATGRIAIAGDEALRFGVSLAVPPERLAAGGLRTAPLRGELVVPRVSLERTGPRDVPLTGAISGKLELAGTPGAPQATLLVQGEGVAVEGRPLGDARLEARYGQARTEATLAISPRPGGTLRAKGWLEADLGLGARRRPLGDAPAEIAVTADGLDLSVLAALVPARVRSAGGTLQADVTLRGRVARLSPTGTARVRDGRVAVAEYGEFTAIAVDARATEDAIEVTQLEVHRGKGKLTAAAALRGLSSGKAKLEGRADASAFALSRAGMTVATLDLHVDATGGYADRTLSVDLTIPRGTIRLPSRQPRPLQPITERKDIVIGRPEPGQGVRAPAPPGAPGLSLVLHVVVPRALFVKGDDPRVDVELRADATWETSGGEDYARGYVETVRGTVEPIAGRTFSIERARVQFTGGPPSAATIDVEAKYENPAAVVTAKIVGPVEKPEVTLSSNPPMDEAQIALLIATGQRELKAGTGAVGTVSPGVTGAEAGRAALGAVATSAFRELVANKLPIDTFSLDSGALRAGKYVTDKIYVGYQRRFEADPTRGENPDEVRIEYHISPRWNLESRYGTAQYGSASLIWSKDY